MATDLTGVWNVTWSSAYNAPLAGPPSLPDFGLYFQFEPGTSPGTYSGRWFNPSLPARAYPNWPYDSQIEAQIFSPTFPPEVAGYPGFDVISLVMHARSTATTEGYDYHETWAGRIYRAGQGPGALEPPILYGSIFANNGNNSVWMLTYNAVLSAAP